MTQKARKGDLRELKSKEFPRGACPRTPQKLWHLFRKSVNIYPRFMPATTIFISVNCNTEFWSVFRLAVWLQKTHEGLNCSGLGPEKNPLIVPIS